MLSINAVYLVLKLVHVVDVAQGLGGGLEVRVQLDELAGGRVEHHGVDNRHALAETAWAAALFAGALDDGGLVQVEALLHHVKFYQAANAGVLVLDLEELVSVDALFSNRVICTDNNEE